MFSEGIPRPAVLLTALATFCLVGPETVARGPDLCLWRHLFQLSACPACGTTRALCAFFHGEFARAVAFNRNVLVAAPTLLSLVGVDTARWLSEVLKSAFSLNSPPQENKLLKSE